MMSKQTNNSSKKVCIIGAGIAGLCAAYDLGKSGFQVVVVESNDTPGGLARYKHLNGYPVDIFYHFICRGDIELQRFIDEIGIVDKLRWREAKTSFYYQGKMYDFGLPTDLMRFSPVPFTQRLRFGYNILRSRYAKDWKKLDRLSACTWLAKEIGLKGYQVIWEPLLRFKFGDAYDQISAAWIWHRIHRVAKSRRRMWEHEQYGYLLGGTATLINAIGTSLKAMPNVSLRTATEVLEVKSIDHAGFNIRLSDSSETTDCNYVLSTIALPGLLKIFKEFPESYQQELEKVEYLGVVCGLLKLKNKLTDSFWINIADENIPFNGIIEYSNLNHEMEAGKKSIIYIPYYLRTTLPRFNQSSEEIMQDFILGLKKINSNFQVDWIEDCLISRDTYAQAICTIGFSNIIPSINTPVRGFYITDSTQFYPEDRTVSAAIRQGRYAATMIGSNL